MTPGIPAQRPRVRIGYENNVYFGCFVEGDQLFLCTCDTNAMLSDDANAAEHAVSRVRKIDLNAFDGDLDGVSVLIEQTDTDAAFIRSDGDFFVLMGRVDSLYRTQDCEQMVLKPPGDIAPGARDQEAMVVSGNKVLYQIDRENLDRGIEIYDANSGQFLVAATLDIKYPKSLAPGLIGGTRPNGNFAVFSLSDTDYVFELDSGATFGKDERGSEEIRVAIDGGQMALARGPVIVVIEMASWGVVRSFNLLGCPEILSLLDKYEKPSSIVAVSELSFHEGWIVFNGTRYFSYVGAIRLGDHTDGIRWLRYENDPTLSRYVGGELVFGLDKTRPVAWDLYTGDIVWRSKGTATAASHLLVGESWVVYPPIAGDILCFKWRKPYTSPHGHEADIS